MKSVKRTRPSGSKRRRRDRNQNQNRSRKRSRKCSRKRSINQLNIIQLPFNIIQLPLPLLIYQINNQNQKMNTIIL